MGGRKDRDNCGSSWKDTLTPGPPRSLDRPSVDEPSTALLPDDDDDDDAEDDDADDADDAEDDDADDDDDDDDASITCVDVDTSATPAIPPPAAAAAAETAGIAIPEVPVDVIDIDDGISKAAASMWIACDSSFNCTTRVWIRSRSLMAIFALASMSQIWCVRKER